MHGMPAETPTCDARGVVILRVVPGCSQLSANFYGLPGTGAAYTVRQQRSAFILVVGPCIIQKRFRCCFLPPAVIPAALSAAA